MSENTSVSFAELTAKEQAIVGSATGWDGKQYFDAKSGIRIELVDGDVATYRVLDKGDQEAPAEEVQETEPAPAEAPVEVTAPVAEAPAPETAPADETAPAAPEAGNTSEQVDTTEPAPENGDAPADAPVAPATEPEATA